ncbi:MAG TPA: endonuclease V [Acidimicrobiia bacterium]|nr:endonuclease V [Acidimicrobiia bacterium]
MARVAWPDDADGLVALQDELRRWAAEVVRGEPLRLPAAPLIGGCFVAFVRGEAGPGRAGDRAFAAAVLWEPGHEGLLRRGRGGVPARSEGRALRGSHRIVSLGDDVGAFSRSDGVEQRVPRRAADVVEQAVVQQAVPSAYAPGLLALREGPVLAAAVSSLRRRPEVLLVDASGADHPRRAGLAVHLGWVLDVPTVGVTKRPLRARPDPAPVAAGAPADMRVDSTAPAPGSNDPAAWVRGRSWPLHLDGTVVAALVCTRTGARPVVAHAGWRTDVETAVATTLAASTEGARAPVPLQEARRVAREARDLAG